ncbi:hypothetical protein M758_5G171300 [Ceratodon purpureus]|nr:hypothetical protein M758_5G171300 [Ceratodon purpureus]
MGCGNVVGGIMGRDLSIVVLLVIFGIPVLHDAAPLVLSPDWMVINDPKSGQPQACTIDLCFVNIICSEGSFSFGFARTSDELSVLAIAFIGYGNIGQPIIEVVWSANRNSPVKDNSTLSLSDGNLVLRDKDQATVVWSTELPPGKNIARLEMQDGAHSNTLMMDANMQALVSPVGNLVMKDADNQTLWESFSYPTDTLMPGQIWTNGMSLIAGSSITNGSEGSYEIVMESKALVLFTTLGSPSGFQPYWMSPQRYSLDELYGSEANSTTAHIGRAMDANGTIPGIDQFMYFRIVICNNDNCSENFPAHIGFVGPQIPIYYFLRLDYDGVLRYYYFGKETLSWNQVTSNNTIACLHPVSCGPYEICSTNGPNLIGNNCRCPFGEPGVAPNVQHQNASNQHDCNPGWNTTSCMVKKVINGSDSIIDLLEVQDVSYFRNRYDLDTALLNGSSQECKKLCLNDCSCAAAFFWSGSTIDHSACFLVSEPLLSMYTTSFVPADELPEIGGQYSAFIKYIRKKDHQKKLSAWKLGVIIACGGLLLLSVSTCVIIVVMEKNQLLELFPDIPPTTFSFKELDIATKHFSKVLGEGGFGTVFEGVLPSGKKVAVKRLEGSNQGEKEFTSEVETVALNHQHLVRLWGFCSEGAHRMLVYECMNNGSLDRWLFREAFLCWAHRYQIAIDTAKGLSYLHQDCRHTIIHLDVKPQNILLDDQFHAKVADFGMSKLFDDSNRTEVMTGMRGTRGYLAPEWLLHEGITVKCDVYSYGMVLLEIVSGRKNMDLNAGPEKYYFPAWTVQRMREEAWNDIVDLRLQTLLNPKELMQVKEVVKIAMWCIQDSPTLRPTMAMVVQMLEGSVEVDDPPLQFDFLSMGFGTEGSVNGTNSTFATTSNFSSERACNPRAVAYGSFCNPDSNSYMSPR